jgi:hypothetical protein
MGLYDYLINRIHTCDLGGLWNMNSLDRVGLFRSVFRTTIRTKTDCKGVGLIDLI